MVLKTINDALPVFIHAINTGQVLQMHNLIQHFPKLLYLRDSLGRNALMLAAYNRNPTMFSYLFSNYVLTDPVFNLNDTDKDGLNAYDWAVLGGNEFALNNMTRFMVEE